MSGIQNEFEVILSVGPYTWKVKVNKAPYGGLLTEQAIMICAQAVKEQISLHSKGVETYQGRRIIAEGGFDVRYSK